MTVSKNIPPSRILRKSLVFLFCFLWLAGGISAAQGQAAGWSTPRRLGPGWFPDIIADQSGHVHLVWASRSDQILPTPTPSSGTQQEAADEFFGYDIVLYTVLQNGEPLIAANDIVALPQTGGTEATRPALLADHNGILHLAFRDTSVWYAHAPADSAGYAEEWAMHQTISQDDVAYFSRLAEDQQGRLHLVFTQNTPSSACGICYHVYYTWSTDGGLNWSKPVDISQLNTGAAKPQILIDEQDNIHVVWEAGRGGSYGHLEGDQMEIMYTASYDQGVSWQAPLRLSAADAQAKNVAFAIDGLDQLVTVWLELPADRIVYRYSSRSGRSWSATQTVEALWSGWELYPTDLDHYAMAADSAGDLHLAVVGRRLPDQQTLDVLHLSWDGNRWSAPESVANLTGDVPEWPEITVANGNQLYLTWFVRDEANIWISDLGQYTVWYAWREINAPYTPPSPWPTPTPLPGRQAESGLGEIAQTTATPDPALLRVPFSTGSVYSENDEARLIGLSLLPAVLLGLVLMLVVVRRR